MRIRLTQIDGALPNVALMKLAHWHRARGDEIHYTRSVRHAHLVEPAYDRVYGSAIFNRSADRIATFRHEFPEAIIGGSAEMLDQSITVESVIGVHPDRYDYSLHPAFTASMGFAARGCRLKCGFCAVPRKEGAVKPVNTIADLWRGDPWPRNIHLLDNDFFGNPQWRERIAEIVDGGFKVCFSQGINIRVVTDEVARAVAAVPYKDDSFKRPRLYTAWDSLGEERTFFRGVDRLEAAGVPPHHLMVYMLVGWAEGETDAQRQYRADKMLERGIRIYPMVHHLRQDDRELKRFQRWGIRASKLHIPYSEYDANAKGWKDDRQGGLPL